MTFIHAGLPYASPACVDYFVKSPNDPSPYDLGALSISVLQWKI